MKNIIFLLLIVAGSVSATAQPYQSLFGKDSTSWAFEYHNLPGKLMDVAKISRDTLINDTAYKIIELSSVRGYLREDTITGKVWYRGEDIQITPGYPAEPWAKEVLAFDYSLQPGDSFDVNNTYSAGSDPVYSKVDSVKYINGSKYIYFDRSAPHWTNSTVPEQFVMIEGSGGNMSPLWKSYGTPNVYLEQYLLCYHKDGIKTGYENIRYAGTCSLTGMGVDAIPMNKENVVIYPNPATGNVFIAFKGKEQQADIASYDVVGKLMWKEDAIIMGNYPHQIEMGNLAAGVYVISIEDKQGASYILKVVKQ